MGSPYAFKFGKYREDGERNDQWVNDNTLNMAYIMGQEDYLNSMLYSRNVFDSKHRVKVRGWVFLNEIRDLLGETATKAGSVVGNLFSNGEPGRNGYITFNAVEATEKDPETGDMIPCVFVNPNVDGLIYDLVGIPERVPFEPSIGAWGEDVNI